MSKRDSSANISLEILPGINKEGYLFIFLFIVLTLFLFHVHTVIGCLMFGITIWCTVFFRDPRRYVPQTNEAIVSPGDGRISCISEVIPHERLELGTDKLTRVSIFLNIFDVHVNRIPVAGKIVSLYYRKGKFLSANLDKASEDNEQQYITIETKKGKRVGVSQIAGLVAKRIVCNLDISQDVDTGQRFGIIRFGSRLDIYLPKGTEPAVALGQRMIGGETIIAVIGKKYDRIEAKAA